MKYTVEIELGLPVAKVVELFTDYEKMPIWQPDLVSFQPINGEPSKDGAECLLIYNMGKRKVEMIEKIIKNDLPKQLHATYRAKGVYNSIFNRFEEIENGKTVWVSENEFQFSGFMRLIGIFMKPSFPKQTLKFMNQFKGFAEEN